MRLVIALVLAGVCALAQPGPTDRVEHGLTLPVHIKGEPTEHYDIRSRMEHYDVPGVSIAVIDDYQIVWAKGYGYRDKERKLPVDVTTLFEAGSISKPVSSAGALRLVDEGRLSLDDDVNGKLKSWRVPENEFTKQQKVTMRRLLSHSAGLTVHGFPGYEAGSPIPTLPEILDGRKPANSPPVRVDIVPGTTWRYSGGGYTVMQLLVTDVTGKTFPAFMEEAVLRRIGMDHSAYDQPLPERLTGNAATGYRNGAAIPGKYHTYPEMAAAGLWTTPSDLSRFGIEIMKSAQGKSNRVLTESTTRAMLTKQSDDYGLGFSLEGGPEARRFSHGGVDEGFEAMLVCYEAGKGAAIITNAQGGQALMSEILLSIAAEYRWPDYVPRERTAMPMAPEALRPYVGRYDSPAGAIQITLTPKGLELAVFGRSVRLAPETETRFFPVAPGIPDITFERDASGKVTGFSGGGMHASRIE